MDIFNKKEVMRLQCENSRLKALIQLIINQIEFANVIDNPETKDIMLKNLPTEFKNEYPEIFDFERMCW